MSDVTLLRAVRVFDGSGFGDPVDVVIDGERIGEIATPGRAPDAGASVIDAAGGYLLPGLIDAHVHLGGPDTLETFARYGMTTVLDMGTWPAERVDSFRGRPGVTDIRSSGPVATSPRSQHAARLKDRPESSLVDSPDDAVRFVADRKAENVDYIKIVIDLPGFDQATVDALVAAAHAEGYLTVIHASAYEAVQMAHHAGTDVITHAPLDRPIDEAFASTMTVDGTVIVPTLTMMEAIPINLAKLGVVGTSYDSARSSVTTLHEAGMPIFAGTDANTSPGVPASPPYGESLHHELELLVGAGLSTVEALNSATADTADYFGLADRGRIAPGLRADLVLLEGDPTADIRATRGIRQVWCAGTARL